MTEKIFVYLLQCKNDSIYTGITNSLERRISEHKTGKGAKYTKHNGVKGLLAFKAFGTRSLAVREELRIKKNLSAFNKRKLANMWVNDISKNLDNTKKLMDLNYMIKN